MSETTPSLSEQLSDALENLRLIQERKAQYVLETDVPLQLVKDERRLEAQIADLQARLGRQVQAPCPYRGLLAFREQDAPFFFGRETFTARLVEAVQQHTLVAVVGPSGSGKSSVVLAGLLSHLRQESPPLAAQGKAWSLFGIRPGNRPFDKLADGLLLLLEPDMTEVDRLGETTRLARMLWEGEVELLSVVERILNKYPEASRLLLVVDQFEELYTLCPDAEVRHRFMDVLSAAIVGQPVRRAPTLSVVLTLRADFMGQALAHRPFADALDQAQTLMLGPMTREELEVAIARPAEQQGVTFEEGLVARILDDVGGEPGNLPLLQFAMTQLWERQEKGRLTHAAYEAIGEVEGALTHYADQVYTGLDKAEQARARRVFVQLVRPGEGTEDTRRLAARAELDEADWGLVQKLADARLVVTAQDPAGQKVVELAHETLIQGWVRLRAWMDEDRAFRLWQERLRAALRQWDASERDKGALLRGLSVAEAERWMGERKDRLSQIEETFVQASLALRERTRRRVMVTGIAPALVLSIIVAALGFYIVTSLVTSSLDERFTNQLLEAGRIVSDSLARREMDHLECARAIAFTAGLAEAVQAGDRDEVIALAQPTAAIRGMESLIIADANGRKMLHMLQHDDGSFEFVEGQFDSSALGMVQALLDAGDPNSPPKRALAKYRADQRYYHFTAIPIGTENKMMGIVVVGTSLETLLPYFKITSLADVIIYLDGGRAVDTTFTIGEQEVDAAVLLEELSTTPALYESALYGTDLAIGENVRIRGRWYRLARGPLQIGNDTLGVFAVALPSQFVVQAGVTSRNFFAVIFSLLALLPGLVGYFVARSLMRTLVHSLPSPTPPLEKSDRFRR